MDKIILIKDAANILGVNMATLRRWDKSGRFKAKRKKSGKKSFYVYDLEDVEDFLSRDYKTLLKLARRWALNPTPIEILRRFYCQDKSIFKARLSRLEFDLMQDKKFDRVFPLIVAIAGEIGNNSFDHNLGNWPDVNGIFFGYNLNTKKIILADRGQGILTTLKKVKPTLTNHSDALITAYTEIISGRAPESRGNGLKFVRDVVVDQKFKLSFKSGDSILHLDKNNKLLVKESSDFIQGCFAEIIF